MKAKLFNNYLWQVARVTKVKKEKFFEKSKKRHLVDARHMLYYLCKENGVKVGYIQKYMADNGFETGHSSIIHGVNIMKEKVKEDKDLAHVLGKIKHLP